MATDILHGLAVVPLERWYIGAMNDALFIINTPPRSSNDDVWHDRPDGPTLVIPVDGCPQKIVQEIVDAHNAASRSPTLERAIRDLYEAAKPFAECKTSSTGDNDVRHWQCLVSANHLAALRAAIEAIDAARGEGK